MQELLLTILGQYVFPVFACVVMGVYVKYTQDNYRKDLATMQENYRKDLESIRSSHDSEMTNVTQALNNNTLAVQKLTDYIERL